MHFVHFFLDFADPRELSDALDVGRDGEALVFLPGVGGGEGVMVGVGRGPTPATPGLIRGVDCSPVVSLVKDEKAVSAGDIMAEPGAVVPASSVMGASGAVLGGSVDAPNTGPGVTLRMAGVALLRSTTRIRSWSVFNSSSSS